MDDGHGVQARPAVLRRCGVDGGGKAGLFDDMLAHVASYTLEEDRVIHHVDGSWNPNWHGDLTRPFRLEGDRLVISGAAGIDPASGEEVVYRTEFTKV